MFREKKKYTCILLLKISWSFPEKINIIKKYDSKADYHDIFKDRALQ